MKTLHLIGCATLIFALGLSAEAFAQVSSTQVAALKSKYPWGCIYLTHTCLIELASVLKDESKIQRNAQVDDKQTASRIQAFITREKKLNISESIAFIQIDLNRLEAGFKRASDGSGVITPIAWSKEEVAKAAELCDRILNSILAANEVRNRLSTGDTPIDVAWSEVELIHDDPYIPVATAFGVLQQFQYMITRKTDQLDKLKGENKALFDAIQKFRIKFENSLASSSQPFYDAQSLVALPDPEQVIREIRNTVVNRMQQRIPPEKDRQ